MDMSNQKLMETLKVSNNENKLKHDEESRTGAQALDAKSKESQLDSTISVLAELKAIGKEKHKVRRATMTHLDAEVFDDIQKLARSTGVSLSKVIEELCKNSLRTMKSSS